MVWVEPFSVIVDRAERSGVFRWNRKPLRVKALSTMLYYSGLSYRAVASCLRGLQSSATRPSALVQEAEVGPPEA